MSNRTPPVSLLRGLLLLSPAAWIGPAVEAQTCGCQREAAQSELRTGELGAQRPETQTATLAAAAPLATMSSRIVVPVPVDQDIWNGHGVVALTNLAPASQAHQESSPRERGFIGVTLDVQDDSITISGLVDGTHAAASGLREGDRIVRVAGREAQSYEDIAQALDGTGSDTTIVVQVERDGSLQDLPVRLSRRPGAGEPDSSIAPEPAAPPESAREHAVLGLRGEELRVWSERFEKRLQELRADLDQRSESLQQSIEQMRARARPLADDARADLEHLRAEAQRWHEERARELEDLQHRQGESMDRLHRRLAPPDAPAAPRAPFPAGDVDTGGDPRRVRVLRGDGGSETIVLDGEEIGTVRIPRSRAGSPEVIVLESEGGQPIRVESRGRADAFGGGMDDSEHEVIVLQGDGGEPKRLEQHDGRWTWRSMDSAHAPFDAPHARAGGVGGDSSADGAIRHELDQLRSEVGKLAGELRALRELLEADRRGAR
jgi:hypothetical protein